jgi:quercetin dioxygenase-like cupin family protein
VFTFPAMVLLPKLILPCKIQQKLNTRLMKSTNLIIVAAYHQRDQTMLKVTNGHSFCANLKALIRHDGDQDVQTVVLFHQNQYNAMLMTIPAGHTVHEHLSPNMLTLQIIAGTGRVIVNDETHRVTQGAWFYIEPNVPHEIISDETLIVLFNMVAASPSGLSSNE